MALNKSVSAVPQVVNAVPAETYMGLYLRIDTSIPPASACANICLRTSFHKSSSD